MDVELEVVVCGEMWVCVDSAAIFVVEGVVSDVCVGPAVGV